MRRCLVRAMYLSAFVVARVYLGRYIDIKCSTFTLYLYRDMADKNTKFGMRLPYGLLINISLRAIQYFKKNNIWGAL